MHYLLDALLALLVTVGICWLVVIWMGKSGSPDWVIALLPVTWFCGSLVAGLSFNKMLGLTLVKAKDHFLWSLASLVFFGVLSWCISSWTSPTKRELATKRALPGWVYTLILYVISWGAVFTAVPFARGMNLQWDLPGWVAVVGGIIAFIIAAIVNYVCLIFGDPTPDDYYCY